MTPPRYAEIGVTSNFSFLEGGSHPQEFVQQASALGLAAIGIADRNTLAGVVRAYSELDNEELIYKPKLLIGARLVFRRRHAGPAGLSDRPRRLWSAVPAAQRRQAARGEGRMPSDLCGSGSVHP